MFFFPELLRIADVPSSQHFANIFDVHHQINLTDLSEQRFKAKIAYYWNIQ